jgi:hypothetical protein
MPDERPQADRILVAQLHGTVMHHAKWRELTGDEHAAAVGELHELATGRADLLAEVAGSTRPRLRVASRAWKSTRNPCARTGAAGA